MRDDTYNGMKKQTIFPKPSHFPGACFALFFVRYLGYGIVLAGMYTPGFYHLHFFSKLIFG